MEENHHQWLHARNGRDPSHGDLTFPGLPSADLGRLCLDTCKNPSAAIPCNRGAFALSNSLHEMMHARPHPRPPPSTFNSFLPARETNRHLPQLSLSLPRDSHSPNSRPIIASGALWCHLAREVALEMRRTLPSLPYRSPRAVDDAAVRSSPLPCPPPKILQPIRITYRCMHLRKLRDLLGGGRMSSFAWGSVAGKVVPQRAQTVAAMRRGGGGEEDDYAAEVSSMMGILPR